MVSQPKYKILSSKRLSKSFRRIDNYKIWESIVLSEKETINTIKKAIEDIKKQPLTITITRV